MCLVEGGGGFTGLGLRPKIYQIFYSFPKVEFHNFMYYILLSIILALMNYEYNRTVRGIFLGLS